MRHQRRGRQFGMAHQGADTQATHRVEVQAAQRIDASQRDQVRGREHALAHAQHQGRAAGDHAAVLAQFGQQPAGLRHRGGLQKVEVMHDGPPRRVRAAPPGFFRA